MSNIKLHKVTVKYYEIEQEHVREYTYHEHVHLFAVQHKN